MNNTFNINRFGLLLKRQWLDFGKIYLMSLVVLTAVIVGFYFFNIPEIGHDNFRWTNNGLTQLRFKLPLFLIAGVLFISIVASTYFNVLGQKQKAIMELMTPASITEKFLCGIFFTAVISITSYLLIFYVVDKIFVQHINHLWENQRLLNYHTNKIMQVSFSNIFDDITEEKEFKFLFVSPFLISSIFLLGSVYFNRFHYIKTAVSITAFFTLAIFLSIKTGIWLMEDKAPIHNRVVIGEKDFIFTAFFWVTTILTLIIWTIAYVRLKEKEV
jgi:hypothetical protein